MKKLSFFLSLILVTTIITTACKKDDDGENPSGSNYLEYKGTRYPLSNGFVEDYGQIGPGSYDVDIFIVSSGVNVIIEDEELVDVTGTGNAVFIDFRSAVAKAVGSATYTFDELSDEAGVFVDGGVAINYNFDTGEGLDLLITGGTVKVTRSGNNYELEFNLEVNGSDLVTGNFKGTMPYFDYSGGFHKKASILQSKAE